ncbi:MAG: VWA domain-containing protein [Clostridia bacterium]|nr:VWA domain-containing protein [Clostridia bacterium]
MYKKITSILIIIVLLMNCFIFGEITVSAPISVSRVIRDNASNLVLDNVESNNNIIYVDYTIQPDHIDVAQIPVEYPDKEIVLVIDKSGSMDWDLYGNSTYSNSRMDMTKAAAVRFIEALKEYPNVKVALVEYSTVAETYSSYGKTLFNLSSYYDLTALKNRINGINPNGGTNIGDGIRHAYNILNTSTDADKYMILLSDGEPSAFSVSDMGYYTSNSSGYGAYYWDYGYSSRNIQSLWNVNFYEGTGNAAKYYVNWSTTGDLGGYALEYSKAMTQKLKSSDLDVNSYFIGFSDVSAANKLEIIANEIAASYKKAMTADEIDQVYQDIAVEVTADVQVSDIVFTDVIPEGLEYMPTIQGMTRNGQTLTKTFENIVYTLNDSKTAYEAEPIEFTLKFKVNQSGDYNWANNTSAIHYTDINGSSETLWFNNLSLTATRTPVENVSSTKANNSNTISWDAYPGALGYNIYQVIGGVDVLISGDEVGTQTSFNQPIQNNDYNSTVYKVEAILPSDVSQKGSTTAETIPDILGLRASRINDTFKIEWLPINGALTYTVTPVIKGVPQSQITITSPTMVGGYVRYNYNLPSNLTYDNDDTIKFIVGATKVNSNVNSAETIDFLLKQLVETEISTADLDAFYYATHKDVHISYQSSDAYPAGVSIFNPLLVLELNLPDEVTTTPLAYTYSTMEVFNGTTPLEATIVRSNGSEVKIYVSLESFNTSGMPENTSINVVTNFAVGFEGVNGQLTPEIFAELQNILPNLKVYDIDKNIVELLNGAYTTPLNNLLEVKSYVLYNKTNKVTTGIFTRDEITGVTSDYIIINNKLPISDEY